jgi:hypothetical protein
MGERETPCPDKTSVEKIALSFFPKTFIFLQFEVDMNKKYVYYIHINLK